MDIEYNDLSQLEDATVPPILRWAMLQEVVGVRFVIGYLRFFAAVTFLLLMWILQVGQSEYVVRVLGGILQAAPVSIMLGIVICVAWWISGRYFPRLAWILARFDHVGVRTFSTRKPGSPTVPFGRSAYHRLALWLFSTQSHLDPDRREAISGLVWELVTGYLGFVVLVMSLMLGAAYGVVLQEMATSRFPVPGLLGFCLLATVVFLVIWIGWRRVMVPAVTAHTGGSVEVELQRRGYRYHRFWGWQAPPASPEDVKQAQAPNLDLKDGCARFLFWMPLFLFGMATVMALMYALVYVFGQR